MQGRHEPRLVLVLLSSLQKAPFPSCQGLARSRDPVGYKDGGHSASCMGAAVGWGDLAVAPSQMLASPPL